MVTGRINTHRAENNTHAKRKLQGRRRQGEIRNPKHLQAKFPGLVPEI